VAKDGDPFVNAGGFSFEHQSRGGPADPPQPQGFGRPDGAHVKRTLQTAAADVTVGGPKFARTRSATFARAKALSAPSVIACDRSFCLISQASARSADF